MLQDAFGKNKDMNLAWTQKYEKIIPIENNSKSIDKQTSVSNKYVMKYEKDIEDIAKMCFIVAKDDDHVLICKSCNLNFFLKNL
jgi:hypothetical protein